MENKTYIFHTDPGHGWLAVPYKDLVALGIQDKISDYSYSKGGTAYLEEDCDAGVFITAYKERFGSMFKFKESYKENTSIRYFNDYSELNKQAA
jgi:hypothetical protein